MTDPHISVDENYRLNPALREFPEVVIKNLLAHKIMEYEAKDRNECLFFQDEAVENDSKAYFILTGEVRVTVKNSSLDIVDFTADINDSVVGELALLNSQVRSANCSIERKATFYTIKKEHFQKIFYSPHEIAYYLREVMLKILLSKFNETNIRKKLSDSNYDLFLNKERSLVELNRKMREATSDKILFDAYKKSFKADISNLINDILKLNLMKGLS